MKTKPFNDILKEELKSNTFAKEYKKELKKIKAEARLREAERDIELGNVTKMFYKPKKKFAKLDTFSKVALGLCIVYFIGLIVWALLTNL